MSSATENFGINFLDEHLHGFAHPRLSTLADQFVREVGHPRTPASIFRWMLSLQPARLGTFLGRVAENADRIEFRCGEKLAEHGEIGLSLTRKAADHVAADPCGRASRRIEEINSRNDSALPKRRIRRSTRGEACWKDRSKYGTTRRARHHLDQAGPHRPVAGTRPESRTTRQARQFGQEPLEEANVAEILAVGRGVSLTRKTSRTPCSTSHAASVMISAG